MNLFYPILPYPNKIIRVVSRAQPVGATPEEHAVCIKSEIEKWWRLVTVAGAEPE